MTQDVIQMYGNNHQNRKDTLIFKNGCSPERQLSVKKMELRNAVNNIRALYTIKF